MDNLSVLLKSKHIKFIESIKSLETNLYSSLDPSNNNSSLDTPFTFELKFN